MRVSRLQAEVAVAAVTAICGITAIVGSLELGIAWSERGPLPGFFPFYLGILLLAASLWNGFRAAGSRDREAEPFLEGEQTRRVIGFFLPMAVYAVVSVLLGLYVGSFLYLAYVSSRHGGYRPLTAIGFGIGFALFLFVVFEIAFQTPLHKGPLEDLLGIH